MTMSQVDEPTIPLPVSAAELQDICAFIYNRTGMVFGENKRYYIERRVTELVNLSGSLSVRA